ncbi:type IV secretory system conjugative DNA transfer family protein [Litorimonas haliclonae]|uniref:type IV secretory system conjugative DNA transfer family protein n=1 Tax=Litorimonas haliclonae TaxID=2081977 RepID=UPI0039EE6508
MNLPKNTQMFGFPRGEARNKEIDNRNKLLATASWQIFPKPFKKGDIWLGRDAQGTPIGVNDDRHVFTSASNRGGKGSGLIIPNLCLWEGSTVVIDPKGENAAITARHRAKRRGHKVVAIDPYNEAKLPQELLGFFNPLDLIDITSDEAIDIAGMIADALIVKANAKDAHWDESARDIISGLILHVCDTEPPETSNLGRVHQLLIKGDPDFRHIMEITAEEEDESDE